MKYFERAPSPTLAKNVKHFWMIEQSKDEAADSREPVLPDGCIEIVFNLSDRFRRFYTDKEFELQPQALVAGQMRRSIVIGPTGHIRLFGIRFHAAGAFAFFRFSLDGLVDRIEALDHVWDSRCGELTERLEAAGEFSTMIKIAESELLRRMSVTKTQGTMIAAAANTIIGSNGTIPVSGVAKMVEWSERRLERAFKERIGVSPKMFSRIVRFQSTIRLLETGTCNSKPDLALEAGYFDQSHMINEFRSFTGVTPSEFLREPHQLSELFVHGS